MVSDQYYEFGSAATWTLIFLNLAFLFQQQKTMLVSDGKNSDPTGTNTTDVRAAYVGRLIDPSKNDFFWTLAKFYSWLLFFFLQDTSALKIQEVNIDLTSDNSLYTYDSHWIWIPSSQLTEPDFLQNVSGASGEYFLTKIPVRFNLPVFMERKLIRGWLIKNISILSRSKDSLISWL